MENLEALISDESIKTLVEKFYGKARQDELLGPVFDAAVEDWPAHFDKLGEFWRGVMFGNSRYKGGMMFAHFQLRDKLTPAHLERWLKLWWEATEATMAPQAAAAFRFKAARIAESMSLALFRDPVTGLRPLTPVSTPIGETQ